MVHQEADAMRRCGRHPNVVELIELIWLAPDDENPHGEAVLVMECAAGGGLFERLVDEGAYSERVAATMLQQIALAIYHIHSRGILHRDIKPENVVFETMAHDSPVKLIDFGTAIALEDENAKVSGAGRIGTWSYWAPEQLNQQPYDYAVDMWSLGVLTYILLVGYHPFDPNGDATEAEVLSNMRSGNIEFDSEEWTGVSEQAKQLVRSLLTKDPVARMTASELVTHPWVRGQDVPSQALPATHERLSAFIKARKAFYGSLLMGMLGHHLASAAGAEGMGGSGGADFDAFAVGWKLFDPEGKGHINASDLRRVCVELGYKVSQRDAENMVMVMSPTAMQQDNVNKASQEEDPDMNDSATISFDRYKTTMQASFLKRYHSGAYIFKQGDPVDSFYIIMRGTVEVRIAAAAAAAAATSADASASPSASPTAPPTGAKPQRVVATLGAGDFFGETGLLEGRSSRAASVVCIGDVEVMCMDKQVFNQVAGGVGADETKLSLTMRQKAEERQRARLLKVLRLMSVKLQQERKYSKGSLIFSQGDPADHFFIVNRGELEMSVATPDGRSVRVKRLKAGDHFGYDALLADSHDTSVTCLTDVELTVVPQHELRLASKSDAYIGTTVKAQHESTLGKAELAAQGEAQILPMMAKAAAAGGGIEYDKYEAMLSQMETFTLAEDETVFKQGDPATSVYLVTQGKLSAERRTDPPAASAASTTSAADDAPASGAPRIIASLGVGDHFGETALLEERKTRNTTVRCVSSACELRGMPNERFKECLKASPQLSDSVHLAAEMRTQQRLRKVIEQAAATGIAETKEVLPEEVIFEQGDRSAAFYLIEEGEVQMTLKPARDAGALGDEDDDEPVEAVPIRRYKAGECFGASGLMPGDHFRRNTATAVTPVKLKLIPHKHFHVLLRDDEFLKLGLQASQVLHAKRSKYRHAPDGSGIKVIEDEMEDEIVQRAMNK